MKMRRTAVMLTALLASNAAVLLFSEPAQAADTFTAYWNGQPFQEFVNPLSRFVAFPVVDNGSGHANVSSVALYPTTVSHGNLNAVSNADIAAQMLLLGIAKSDILAQLDMLLGSNATYAVNLTAARNAILGGDYKAAVPHLINTPADVKLFCGPVTDGPHDYQWYVGAPAPVDCDLNGSNDVVQLVTATSARVNGGVVTGVDFSYSSRPFTGVYTAKSWLGFGYSVVAVGAITTPTTQTAISAVVNDLDTNAPRFSLSFTGTFSSGDNYWTTVKGYPGAGATVYAVLSQSKSSFSLTVNARYATCHQNLCSIKLQAILSTTTGISLLRYLTPVGDKTLALEAANFPTSFTIQYDVDYQSDVNWNIIETYLVQLDMGSADQDLEIRGTYRSGWDDYMNFQVVGFPSHAELKLDPGWNEGCGSTNSVFAMDLTKGDPIYTGRFRSALLDGRHCDNALDVTIVDVDRARLMTSRQNPWDGGGPLALIAATTYPMSDSRITVMADPDKWYKPSYRAQVDHAANADLGTWLLISPCLLSPCAGVENHGTVVTSVQPGWTPVFWMMGSNELSLWTCRPTNYVHQYGFCP